VPKDRLSEVTETLRAVGGAATAAEIAGRMAGHPDPAAVGHLLEYLRVEGEVRHQQDGRWVISHAPL